MARVIHQHAHGGALAGFALSLIVASVLLGLRELLAAIRVRG